MTARDELRDAIAAVDRARVERQHVAATEAELSQRCVSCEGTITYQAFSGGREYYCPNCDDVFPYDSGAAPRRVQMIADGRHVELHAEMSEELGRRAHAEREHTEGAQP